MLPEVPYDVQCGIEVSLKERTRLLDFSFVGGGCINHAGKLDTTSGSFFLKWNDEEKLPSLFESEAKGLDILRNAGVIDIPEVVGYGNAGKYQYLILKYIPQHPPSKMHWRELGTQLAKLHRVHEDFFGLDHDNYIGSLRQLNNKCSTWVEFFVRQRLHVQVRLASDSGIIGQTTIKKFESLYEKLPSLIPEERSSLLHGDLWIGNVMTNEKGSHSLIDPAVYYGNRETDLAMTKLFGEFDDMFYQSYMETFPLMPRFQERVDLYNLYPLLVHLNLFGRQYLSRIVTTLNHFT